VNTSGVPLVAGGTSRFVLVSYLPTYAGTLFLLILVWAGAPGGRLSFGRAWQTATGFGAVPLVFLAIIITLVSVLFHPLQASMVRLLEGRWFTVGRRRQLKRKRALEAMASYTGDKPSRAEEQRAGVAGAALRQRFPLPDELVRPTTLGNVLAAMEDDAGRTYGWDSVVTWPRLYPLLSDTMRTIVNDRRDALDITSRVAVTAAVCAAASVVLLSRAGWWLALSLIPMVTAVLAYWAAVQAALALSESVHTAFDLHRFDLLKALHVPLPADLAEERVVATALCGQWREGNPAPVPYHHPEPD
jgi:hypothetical protein